MWILQPTPTPSPGWTIHSRHLTVTSAIGTPSTCQAGAVLAMSLAMSSGPAAVSAPPPASPPALCAASPPGALAGALRLAGLRTPCARHLRAPAAHRRLTPAAHRRLTPALAAGARVLVLAVCSLILPGAESTRPPRAPLQPSEREGPAFHASPPIRPRSHCRVAARSRMRPRARKDKGLSTCFVWRGCLASMQGRGTEPLWGFGGHACPRPQQGWSGHGRARTVPRARVSG